MTKPNWGRDSAGGQSGGAGGSGPGGGGDGTAGTNFWSLTALAVQPGYAFGREALRHLVERMFGKNQTAARRARLRAANSIAAGVVLCACAALIAILAWPASRWTGSLNDLVS